MTQVPALLALWLAGQAADSGELQGLGTELLHLTAEVARREGATGVVSYEGNAVLRSESVLLRADTLTYDEAAQRVEARGRAMLVAGEFVAVADALALDVPAEQVTVTDGVVLQKRNVSPEALRAAQTPEELLRLGQNALALRGARIQRLGPGHFRVEEISLTPCDCDPRNPSWRIRAREAEVVAGQRATLRGWQVLVGDVPVLLPGVAIPWTEVPLSSRQSGLLFPGITFQGMSGFGLEVPYFWAPHPSFDFTLTPGYSFGGGGAEDFGQDGSPASPTGVRGPRLHTEFRYFPVQGTEGRLGLGLVYDLRNRRHPLVGVSGGVRDGEAPVWDEARGLRGSLSLDHTQDLGKGLGLRANLGLVSDGNYVQDQSTDVLGRQAEYTRSTVLLTHRGEDHALTLDAVLRQDLRTGHHFFRPNLVQSAIGGQGPVHVQGPTPLHRLPGLTLSLPERHLAGPLFGGLQLAYARLAPFAGRGGDEGPDGIASPGLNAEGRLDWRSEQGQLDGQWDEGERERRNRLDVMPRLSASLPLGQVLRLTPSAAWRQTVYLVEATGRTEARGYPVLQTAAESRLARGFGEAGAWTHVITPRLVGRWVPFVQGAEPGFYDALDLPFRMPGQKVDQPDRLLQAMVEVQQRLVLRGGGEVLRFDVGQGVDLLPDGGEAGLPRRGDAFARLSLRVGRVSGEAAVWMSPGLEQVNQGSAGLSLDLGPAAAVSLRYQDILAVGSERTRRGIDALVGGPPDEVLQAPVPRRFQQVHAAGRWTPPVRGLGLAADVLLEPSYVFRGSDSRESAWPLASASLQASFAPACDCWRLDVRAGALRTEGLSSQGAREIVLQPTFGFNLTIANFGTFGI